MAAPCRGKNTPVTQHQTRPPADEWVPCSCGMQHWGHHGAAGVLTCAAGAVLLQHRAEWCSDGGTWGLPGGARHAGEPAVTAALREAAEETALDAGELLLTGLSAVDHGPWSYTTVLASAPRQLPVDATDPETADVRWVPADEVEQLPLHPGLAAAWPALRPAMGVRLHVVVDVANVMGSRPNGWWHDRAGAASRLLAQVAAWAGRPLPDADLPAEPKRPALHSWFVAPTAVVEGAARSATAPPGQPPLPTVEVVAAKGSGDDALVDVVGALDGPVLAVTADRELRGRFAAAGATVTGPGWLLDRLPQPPSSPASDRIDRWRP